MPKNQEMFIQKRKVSLLYGLNISIILLMVSQLCLQITMIHLSFDHWFIPVSLYAICIWLMLFFLISKNWMIFYRSKWTFYTLQLEWQQLINPKLVTIKNQNNWYISNNKKYGNSRYIYKLFGIISIIQCAIFIICIAIVFIIGFEIMTIAIGAIGCLIDIFIPILFYGYIVRKTHPMQDIFWINWESKFHAKLLIVFALILGTGSIGLVLHFHFYGSWEPIIFESTFVGICLFIMNYVSTQLVTKKSTHKHGDESDMEMVNTTTPETTNSPTPNISSFTDITLNTIMRNKQAFHLFMKHLGKEYSMECLLSFIEFTQFQNYLYGHIDNENKNNDFVPDKRITLAENIPISAIIEQEEVLSDDGKDDFFVAQAKIKAHRLYNKYVRIGAEFEINISSTERRKIKNILESMDVLLDANVNINDLYIIFEECRESMIQWLQYSLTRMRYQSDFVQIVALCVTD